MFILIFDLDREVSCRFTSEVRPVNVSYCAARKFYLQSSGCRKIRVQSKTIGRFL